MFELVGAVVQAVGWGLVHFVWQAVLVGALYAVTRAVLPRGNPRYVASMLALVVLAVLPAGTIWHEVQALTRSVDLGNVLVTTAAGAVPEVQGAAGATAGWLAVLGGMLPWLVLAWACGVVVLGARVARQWLGLRAIVRAAEALPAWQDRARMLGERLGLGRAVRVLASVRIATPTLVGWVRPVVVMPLAMLARMPAEQVDLILAHELAHLRRCDHVANLFQVVLETLFFYHPVVHWISRDARNERELCCDAVALRASGGSRRDFVAALAGLEEFRCDHADLVLAASGGVLVERAWFIAGVAPARRRVRPGLDFALLALFGMLVVLAMVWRQQATHARVEAVLAANASALQNQLATRIGGLPIPLLRDGLGVRPKLAPLALVQQTAPAPAVVPVVAPAMPVAGAMRIAVTDLAVVPTRLQPVAVQRPVVGNAPTVAATPLPLRTVAPVYPSQALLNGVQGQVEVQFLLNAAGVPRDLQVVRSSASGAFDAAALSALSRWRFAPQAEGGRRYRQTFTFRLGTTTASDAATASACLVQTGTHICRPVSDTAAGVATLSRSH